MPKKIIQECLGILAARCASCNCMTYFYCAPLQVYTPFRSAQNHCPPDNMRPAGGFCVIRNAIFYIHKKSDWFIPITSYYKYIPSKLHIRNFLTSLPIHLTWLCPRPISNSQLHVLPHFHLCPIYLVVFKGSYNFRWDISS